MVGAKMKFFVLFVVVIVLGLVVLILNNRIKTTDNKAKVGITAGAVVACVFWWVMLK